MTDTTQRLAIAEACRWGDWNLKFHELRDGKLFAHRSKVSGLVEVPDYPSDLNAMHEALKTLNDEQVMAYRDTLMAVANGFDALEELHKHLDGRPNEWHGWAAREATAEQKAKAFLITIGKYIP